MTKLYKYLYISRKISQLFNSAFIFKSILNLFMLFTIFFCISFIIVATAINDGFKNEIVNKLIKIDGDMRIFSSSNYPLNNSDYEFITNLYQDNDVNLGQVISQNAILKKGKISDGIILNSVNKDAYKSFNLNSFLISGEINDSSVLIGSMLAEKMSINLYDTVYIINYDFNKILKVPVSGVFKTDIPIYDKHNVYGNNKMFNTFLGFEKNTFESIVINSENSEIVKEKLIKDNNKYYVISWMERFDNFLHWLFSYDVPIKILLVFIFIISLINISSSIFLDIHYRKKENKILWILGLSNNDIKILYVIKNLFILLISSLFSLLFLISFIYIQSNFGIIKIPEKIYLLEYLPLEINLFNFASLILFLTAAIIIITLTFSRNLISFNNQNNLNVNK